MHATYDKRLMDHSDRSGVQGVYPLASILLRLVDVCDPYMEITAYRLDGSSVTKKTQHLNNDPNPDWNEWFNFGRGEWKHIEVSIWDHDRNRDDPLSTSHTMNLLMGGHDNERFECFDDGYGILNYRLTI